MYICVRSFLCYEMPVEVRGNLGFSPSTMRLPGIECKPPDFAIISFYLVNLDISPNCLNILDGIVLSSYKNTNGQGLDSICSNIIHIRTTFNFIFRKIGENRIQYSV